VYWKGSHYERMSELIKLLVARRASPVDPERRA
jgi:uncharacterized protein with PIN domain